jgi:flagellar hook-associated protein 2
LTLGEGDLSKNDTFTQEVYDNVENAVDPSKSFNGTGSEDPNLQSGFDVTSGSFQINGTDIAVAADDSINSVLDTINSSGAGVTATFDAATEKVLLTQNTPGSTQDIVLSNDTSGFLAAAKLAGAVATPGEDGTGVDGSQLPLTEVDIFSGVQSGSISVNGTSISIDVSTDTLTDVVDRITASAAGVTASYDSSSQRVSLSSNDSESQLVLDSGSTNFFAAVEITDGTYEAYNDTIEVQTGGLDVVNASDLAVEYAETESTEPAAIVGADQDAAAAAGTTADTKMLGKLVNIIANSMNALFDNSAITASPDAGIEAVRNDVRSAVTSWFDSEGPQFNTDFGIGFDFEKTEKGVFKFSPADQSRFENALASPQSAAAVHQALFGAESDGLFNQLHSALTAAATGSESKASATGLFVDLSI